MQVFVPFYIQKCLYFTFTTTGSWMPDYRSEITLTSGISKVNFINIEFI